MGALSLYDKGVFDACPTPFNMAGYVLEAGRATPGKIALEVVGATRTERWSHGELRRAVLGTAGALVARGLVPGDRLLLRIGNESAFPILFLGAIAAGIVPVPTSTGLAAPEVRRMIRDLGPALVCVGEGMGPQDGVTVPVAGPREIAAMRRHAPAEPLMGDPDRLAFIVYTSGTSGQPRAVMHAHRAVWARRMMWRDWYGLTPQDRMMHAGAFNWTYTLGTGLMDPWAIGAQALIPAPGLSRRDLVASLKTHRATIFAAAPGVYRQILATDCDLSLPDLRHALSAGEKLPPAIRRDWETRSGRKIYEALGMSECSTFISQSPAMTAPTGSTGRPQKGRRVAVLSPLTHRPVAVGEAGVLAVSRRDPGLMLGYRGAPAETQARFAGEWFLTGDVVAMDEKGFVTYLGRDDDMMNAGGYRVSPVEVESVLNHHPGVLESAAAAVEIKPDTFVIAAFYRSKIELPDADLAAYCQSRLADYKRPRLFVRLDALPKGANGKLRRGVLREWRRPQ